MTRYDTSTTLGWMDAIDTLKVVVIIVDRFFLVFADFCCCFVLPVSITSLIEVVVIVN